MSKLTEARCNFEKKLSKKFIQADKDEIMTAYDLMKVIHRLVNEEDRQGQEFLEHPQRCATILMKELKIYDKTLIISILLHDIINVPVDIKKMVSFKVLENFGEKVGDIILSLVKFKPDYIEGLPSYINSFKDDSVFFLELVNRLDKLRNYREHSAKEKKYRNDFIVSYIKDTEQVLKGAKKYPNPTNKDQKEMKALIGLIRRELKKSTDAFIKNCKVWGVAWTETRFCDAGIKFFKSAEEAIKAYEEKDKNRGLFQTIVPPKQVLVTKEEYNKIED